MRKSHQSRQFHYTQSNYSFTVQNIYCFNLSFLITFMKKDFNPGNLYFVLILNSIACCVYVCIYYLKPFYFGQYNVCNKS